MDETAAEALKTELEFFESQRDALLETHRGQFALISGREIVGVYTTESEAYEAGLEKLGNKPFLIREIREEDRTFQAPALFVGLNIGPDA